MKAKILETLGETEILLPSLIATGLTTLALVGRLTGLAEGDWLSIDGETGEMFLDRREMIIERPEAELASLGALRAQATASV